MHVQCAILCALNCASCYSNCLPFICSTQYLDGISLQEIQRSLTPYTRLTLDHFVREDVNKLKVRRALSKVIPTKPLLLILPPSLPPSIPHSIIFIPNSLPPLFSPSSSPSQYKDQVPKHPQIAYMLFSKQKGPKVKFKHPGLTSRELAVKLGEAVLTMVKKMFTVGIRLEYGGSQIAIIFVPDFLCSSSSPFNKAKGGSHWFHTDNRSTRRCIYNRR